MPEAVPMLFIDMCVYCRSIKAPPSARSVAPSSAGKKGAAKAKAKGGKKPVKKAAS